MRLRVWSHPVVPVRLTSFDPHPSGGNLAFGWTGPILTHTTPKRAVRVRQKSRPTVSGSRAGEHKGSTTQPAGDRTPQMFQTAAAWYSQTRRRQRVEPDRGLVPANLLALALNNPLVSVRHILNGRFADDRGRSQGRPADAGRPPGCGCPVPPDESPGRRFAPVAPVGRRPGRVAGGGQQLSGQTSWLGP